MIRRPPRSTQSRSSAASDVYKRQRLEDVAVTLQRIDHPGRQVMLQARIVEVSDTGSDEVKTLVNAVYELSLIHISEPTRPY